MSISNYLEAAILDAVYNNTSLAIATPHISLHTADPGETGASEVSGGSYARQAGSFAAAVGGTVTTDTATTFSDLPATTVTHIGVWDAVTAGNFLWGGAMDAPESPGAGDGVSFAAGEINVTLD